MGQLVLFFALQLLGSSACLAVGPTHERGLAVAMGFLVGLAIAVFLALPLLLLGVFTVGVVVPVLAVAWFALIWLAVKRGTVTARTAGWVVVGAIGLVALCVPFCLWDVSTMTYDSTVFVEYAQALRDDHELRLETLGYLHSWGSFLIVAHALSLLTGDPFLYALAPAFAISLLATVAVALHRGLDLLAVPPRIRVLAVVVVVLVILAVPLFRLHTVYVHANLTAAGYLFVFAALFWLADATDDGAYLPVAFLGLLAFCFARVESTMFAVPFLVLTLSQTRLARAAILRSYAPFTVLLVTWLLLMTSVIPTDSDYLTPTRSLLMVAAVVGIFIGFQFRGLVPRLLPFVPQVLLIVAVVAVTALAVLRFDMFETSFVIWQRDLWLGSFWGYFLWPAIVVFGVISLRVAAPPSSRPLRYGIALFFILVTLLSCLGDDYRAGRYGSLTRVTLHIVPLLCFYAALTLASAHAKSREPVR